MAANALGDVSETVEQVAAELSKINAPDFGTVISAVEQDACAGCKLRLHCWESRRDDTVTAVLDITKAIRTAAPSPQTARPRNFAAGVYGCRAWQIRFISGIPIIPQE